MAWDVDEILRPLSGPPAMFITALVHTNARNRADRRVGAVLREFADQLPEHDDCPDSLAAYYALCERAWLVWCRLAFDDAARRGLRQMSTRPFIPRRIRSAEHARRACARLDRHLKLLDLLASRGAGPDWERCMESARHVHGATQRALRFAARADRQDRPDSLDLPRGVASAADALLVAIASGFIPDPRKEIQVTLEAMTAAVAALG